MCVTPIGKHPYQNYFKKLKDSGEEITPELPIRYTTSKSANILSSVKLNQAKEKLKEYDEKFKLLNK